MVEIVNHGMSQVNLWRMPHIYFGLTETSKRNFFKWTVASVPNLIIRYSFRFDTSMKLHQT